MKTPLFSQSSSRGRGLDLGRGAEGVLARVDVLAAAETCEDLGAAVAHASRLHVEQRAVVGLERVADVAERGAVRQDDLPVGACARQQLPVELGPGERAAGQGHDAPVPLAHVAEIERFAERGLQAVDQGQPRIGKPVPHRASRARGSFGCGASGMTVTCIQSASGSAQSRRVELAPRCRRGTGQRPLRRRATRGRLQSRTRCPSSASLAAAAASARSRSRLRLSGSVRNLDLELDQELHGVPFVACLHRSGATSVTLAGPSRPARPPCRRRTR